MRAVGRHLAGLAAARRWAWWASRAAASRSPPCRSSGLVAPPGRIAAGRIVLAGNGRPLVLTDLAEPEMRKIRGGSIAMIFQEPMTSLNPVFTVGVADRRGRPPAPGGRPGRGPAAGGRDAPQGEDPRARSAGSAIIPTNSPAACGSGQ